MSEELKPCPFCGYSMLDQINVSGWYHVKCDNCGTVGPYGATRKDNIDDQAYAWNTRAELSAVPELVEALETGIETLRKASRELTTEHRSFLRGKVWGKPAIDKMKSALAKYKGEVPR